MYASDPAAAQAAMAAGLADFEQRQQFYGQHPEGVAMGFDPPADPWRPPPHGLGYSTGVDPVAVYVADSPRLVPQVLPVPVPVDTSAGPALTGMTHGGYGYQPAPAAPGVVFVSPAAKPRRSLWNRLLGRG
jgi:hypothetical protein